MRDRKDVFDDDDDYDGSNSNGANNDDGDRGDGRRADRSEQGGADEMSAFSGGLGRPDTMWMRLLSRDSAMADASYPSTPPSASNISPFPQIDRGAPPRALGKSISPGAQPPGAPTAGQKNQGAPNAPHPNPVNRATHPNQLPPPKLPTRPDMPGAAAAVDPEGAPMRAYPHFNDDHYTSYTATLQQRRAEDERRTGRRWPTNALSTPVEPDEVTYFDQLAVALGEVSPRVLARASALRYVKAARTPQEDPIAATDIYAIIFFGLGLTIRPLDCSSLPQVLAVYHRTTREIYLDRSLLQNLAGGTTLLDPHTWRRVVDSSPLTRFLLAWCAAVHLTDNYDIPLALGFAPVPAPATPQGAPNGAAGPVVNNANQVSSDTLNRYRKAMEAAETLLAPAHRLWQQIAALNLPLNMGERDWRARIRAIYGYTGPAYDRPAGVNSFGSAMGPMHAGGGYGQSNGGYNPAYPDPAEQLVRVLAERNSCPRLFVESQLDGAEASPDWGEWSQRLTQEIPTLHMRYLTAARMFSMASAAPVGAAASAWAPAAGANPFSALGRTSSPQMLQATLSL